MRWRTVRRVLAAALLLLLVIIGLLLVFPAIVIRPLLAQQQLHFERVDVAWGQRTTLKLSNVTQGPPESPVLRAAQAAAELEPWQCWRDQCVLNSLVLEQVELDLARLPSTDMRSGGAIYRALASQLASLAALREYVKVLTVSKLSIKNLQPSVNLEQATLQLNADAILLTGDLNGQRLQLKLKTQQNQLEMLEVGFVSKTNDVTTLQASGRLAVAGAPMVLNGRFTHANQTDFTFDLQLEANGAARVSSSGKIANAQVRTDLSLAPQDTVPTPMALLLALRGTATIPALTLPGVQFEGIEISASEP